MLEHIEPGDLVRRLISGIIPMMLTVSAVDNDYIYCGDWMFRRDTGGEVDEDLGWDGLTRYGSFIEPVERDTEGRHYQAGYSYAAGYQE